jgi:uncharacterized protein YkwD
MSRRLAPLALGILAVALPAATALPASASASITLPGVLSKVLPGSAPAPAAPAAPAAPCANTTVLPTATNGATVRRATLCLLNKERTSRGLVALRASRQLRKVAQNYSGQMVTHSFFAHVGYDGSTLRSRVKTGTSYLNRVAQWSLGENLYWGSDALATPAQSVDAWMHSPGHRANVLNGRFRDIGIGIAIGAPQNIQGGPAATYATEFGTRRFH